VHGHGADDTERTYVLGEATLAELREQVLGPVITPSDPDHDEARQIWNHVTGRLPALIVRCSGVADVITAVGFARSEGCGNGLRRRAQRSRIVRLRRRGRR
jgi:hypothetical protein